MTTRFHVRDPQETRDPLKEARQQAERDRINAEKAIRALEKMQADDRWAAEHIRDLADWQRDALYRVLGQLQNDG